MCDKTLKKFQIKGCPQCGCKRFIKVVFGIGFECLNCGFNPFKN